MANFLPEIKSTDSLSFSLEPESITPDYFIKHYMDFISRFISKGAPSMDTLKSYDTRIKFFIRWCLEHGRHPLAMSDYQMRMYREYLIQSNYAPASIGVMLVAVRTFFKTAKNMGLIKENPCDGIDPPHINNNARILNYYTPEQIRDVCNVFENEEDHFIRYRNMSILYLMGVEGLRNVEIHRICREDINWDVKAIMVRGKGFSGRLDPIYPCDETLDILSKYIKTIDDECIEKDGRFTPLFVSLSNSNIYGRISRNGIRFIMNKALSQAGLKRDGQSCHIFRHSCGTNLYRNTKDLRIVQETLRQRDPKVTAKYAHVDERINKRYTSLIAIK